MKHFVRIAALALLTFLGLAATAQTPAAITTRGAMSFQDTWNAGQTYTPGDVVTFGGGSYISRGKINKGNIPSGSPAQWGVVSQPGVTNFGSLLGTLPLFEFANIPRPQLVSWFQALHNARNQKVRVAVFGDSYVRCWVGTCSDGPTVSSNRWIDQFGTSLRNLYGNGGTGFRTLINQVTETLDTEYFATTGTVSSGPGQSFYGPSQTTGTAASSLVQMNPGSTITFTTTIPYDHLLVMCLTSTGTGSIAVTIDGSSAGTLCGTPTSSGTAYNLATSNTVTQGTHTAVLTSSGTSYVYAVSAEAGTAGVVFDNYSVGGATSQWFGGSASTNMAWADLVPPSLGIFALQTNDNAIGISPAIFTTYMTAAIQNLQGLSTNPSIVLQVPPFGGVGSQAGSVSFAAAQLALAQALGTDYVNMQDRYGTAPVASSLLNNNHPNDKLSLDEFTVMWAKLVDAAPNNGGFGASAGGGGTSGCTANCTFTGTTNMAALIASGSIQSAQFTSTTVPSPFSTTGAFFATNSGQFTLYNFGGSVDQKAWDFVGGYGNGVLVGRAVNDANTAASIWMQVVRSGTAITSTTFTNLAASQGYSGTKVAGSCTFTIAAGIITAVTGC